MVHSCFTNLVFYLESKLLTGAQRMPLHDLAFDYLPVVTGAWWHFTDYLIYSMLFSVGFLVIISTFVAFNFRERRPIHAVFVLKRYFQTIMILQTLRILSFMFTLLPGSSVQCLYTPTEAQLAGPASDFVSGVADPAGNPPEWEPPTTLYDILFRIDPATGCGDLMFSSHTVFATLCVMLVWDYFPWRASKLYMAVCITFLIPLTLASRKHYTVDVLTSLYLTPIVYELMRLKMPDRDTTAQMAKHYDVVFQKDREDSLRYTCVVGGQLYKVSQSQLPQDFEISTSYGVSSGAPDEEEYLTLRKDTPPGTPPTGGGGGETVSTVSPDVQI